MYVNARYKDRLRKWDDHKRFLAPRINFTEL